MKMIVIKNDQEIQVKNLSQVKNEIKEHYFKVDHIFR